MQRYLAIDLGAESGRHVLGSFDGERIGIEEVHRFPNEPVSVSGELHWDALRLWHEVRRGIAATAARNVGELAGIGLDTWGVDYALLGERGTLIANPYHYRDARTDGIMERVSARVPAADMYAETGIQFMQFNTLFQLCADLERTPRLLTAAQTLLHMPDLFNYWLTGEMLSEFTIVSTSQMYNPVARTWATGLLDRLGLPSNILRPIVQPGTSLGPLRSELAAQAGLRAATVIAPACHDTGSAVAAIAMTPATVYLSSGTWSLMGAEVPRPIITPEARAFNFTNEGGVGGTIRLLKNIMGMWLLQSCRRQWGAEGANYDYATLVGMASAEPVLRSVLHVDDNGFLNPADMRAAIVQFCSRTGQPAPASPAEFVQTIIESLALRYRYVVEALQQLTGTKYDEIRVVGGGARNRVLNQFTADATGCRVVAGPIEATALGNIAMQMVGTGAVSNVSEARGVIDRSFPTESFEPRSGRERWDEAYSRLSRITGAAVGANS